VQKGWTELYGYVERESGAAPESVRDFFATGMLITVATAMDLFSADESWAQKLMPDRA
jgi:hypothetical protein